MQNSIFRKELKKTRFSIKALQKKVAEVLTVLDKHLPNEPKLTVRNSQLFASYLSDACNMPLEAALSFLQSYLPLSLDTFGRVRLALAFISKLPLFMDEEFKLLPLYDGTPSLDVHARIVHTTIYLGQQNATGKPAMRCHLFILLMTTHKAGLILEQDTSMSDAYRLMKLLHVYKRKDMKNNAPMVNELTGMYCTITFGNKHNKVDIPIEFKVSSEELKLNRALLNKRLERVCKRTGATRCALCPLGMDQCLLACRHKTKRIEK